MIDRNQMSANSPPQRILVRGVNWLGDAVMTTPALQRLREAHPQAHITLLTHEKLKDLWLHHPDIDAVVTFKRGEGVLSVANKLRAPAVLAGFREGFREFKASVDSIVSELRPVPDRAVQAAARVSEKLFQVAIVFPNSPRSALEVWLARIPRRIGYGRPWRNWFLTVRVPPRSGRAEMKKRSTQEINRLISNPVSSSQSISFDSQQLHSAHQLHEYLHLVAALGARTEPVRPFLHVTAPEVEGARGKFGLSPSSDWLGIVPGAEYGPAKRWPREHFLAAARELQRRTGCGVLLLGGKSDSVVAQEIATGLRGPASAVRDVTGQTALRELCALLTLCRAVLTNDTGPMHVAAAVGTPVIVPFGSTSPELTGPGLPGDFQHRLLKSDALCSPCFRRECPIDFRCMNGISVERVVQAALEVLTQNR